MQADLKETTSLLDKVNYPDDLRKLSSDDLPYIADEVRQTMIHAVAQTGGHLGAGLGVVELTVALHYVFNTPKDKIIWDVGHQAYPHKILTGRKDRIHTLRQGAVYLVLQNVMKVNMIHLVRHIPQHQFHLVWVWLLPIVLKAMMQHQLR